MAVEETAQAEVEEAPVAAEAEAPSSEEEEDIKALAAKISASMTGGDEEAIDEDVYARYFEGEGEEPEDLEGADKKKKKKGKRKDRKLVFDEELGRLVQVKKRRKRGSSFDLDDLDDFSLDEF